jgi:hypothetical protein
MPTGRNSSRTHLLDSLLLFSLTAILVFPLWRLNYLRNWQSIEATFIADGRMLRENWAHHLWQPLWYCGTRTGYVYPPGPRYGVAIFCSLIHASYAHAYHILIALFYAAGMVAVYLFVRAGTGSRRAGWMAAVGVALVSPCFLLLPNVRGDSPMRVPWRLHVLMTYGEGPHISSLAMLPLVWLGAWKRFCGGGLRWLMLGAGAAALVVSINFYGATTLALTFPILVWCCWLERRDWHIVRDAFCIAVLAYGLCAWWLVPSFLRITMRNLSLVSPAGNSWSLPVFVAVLGVYVFASVAFRRYGHAGSYSLFVWSGFALVGAFTLGYQWFRFQVAGDLGRLLPEFDVFAILCAVQIIEAVWSWQPKWRFRWAPEMLATAMALLCLLPSWPYLRHPFIEFPSDSQWRQRVEFKTSDWLQRHCPDQRVWVTGTIRYWHNVWSNVGQGDGGSLQGILNPLIPTIQWRMRGEDPVLVRFWLQALGVDVIVVPGANSQEPYKDLSKPEIYNGWPLLRDDGEGNRYYSTSRRVTGIVRIVNRLQIESLPPIPADNESVQLKAYVDAVEPEPLGGDDRFRTHYHWNNSDQWEIDSEIQPGESLLLQENYDPFWRATVDGRRQDIRRDPVGFMLLDLPPGKHLVQMTFETPLEVTLGRLLTFATLTLIGALSYRRRLLRSERSH